MKGDFTRFTWKPEKHYSDVRLQQGRVALDSDWNEQAVIVSHLRETGVGDIVGRCGAPRRDGGFDIFVPPDGPGDDLIISAGRIYVDGILCEAEIEDIPVEGVSGTKAAVDSSAMAQLRQVPKDQWFELVTDAGAPGGNTPRFVRIAGTSGSGTVILSHDVGDQEKESDPRLRRALTYTTQPDLPGAALPPKEGKGLYFAYLDVWRRHITALEDPEIRESALGGPDTATRAKTVWQVKLLKAGEIEKDISCLSKPTEWTDEIAPSDGRLRAGARPEEEPEKPCVVPATAGYTRLENQLYRVEIHDPGKLGTATFKWSRENASIVTEWLDQNGNRLTVKNPGRDKVLGFAPGQWVEVTDDAHELTGKPGILVKLADVIGDDLIIDPDSTDDTIDFEKFSSKRKIRRWDMPDNPITVDVPPENDGWIRLESGIEVHFEQGPFKTGDYWLIPARAFIGEFAGDVEWPEDEAGEPLSRPPHGIEHHYCKLALLAFDGEAFEKLDDCRKIFPTATELLRFFRVGGDGQEAKPGERLPCRIEAGVTNGQWPVAGARVRFEIVAGGGMLHSDNVSQTPLTVSTESDGVARCAWQMPASPPPGDGDKRPCLRVEATLLDDRNQRVSSPLSFGANLSLAADVAYDPSACAELKDAKAHTVQDAIDKLCARIPAEEPGIGIKDVVTTFDVKEVLNDDWLPVGRLINGLSIRCVQEIDPRAFANDRIEHRTLSTPAKPNCVVTLDLPYPIGGDQQTWEGLGPILGFQPLILAGKVEVVNGREIHWQPSIDTWDWLRDPIFKRLVDFTDRFLVRLTLKGNFIWLAGSGDKPEIYLDGHGFGQPDPNRQRVDLRYPSGRRRGGDFEMWFWLVQTAPREDLVLDVSAIANIVVGEVRLGEPSADLKVTLANQDGMMTRTPNTRGEFNFGMLGDGQYEVSVQVPGAAARLLVKVPGEILSFNPFDFPKRTIEEVFGIGPERAKLLVEAGVEHPAQIASLRPDELAGILSVSQELAAILIFRAQRLLSKPSVL